MRQPAADNTPTPHNISATAVHCRKAAHIYWVAISNKHHRHQDSTTQFKHAMNLQQNMQGSTSYKAVVACNVHSSARWPFAGGMSALRFMLIRHAEYIPK
jgi:hypothetical protein